MGFLTFLLQTSGNFLGLLVGVVGFIWVLGSIGAGDWLAAREDNTIRREGVGIVRTARSPKGDHDQAELTVMGDCVS